ncbi:uncharacterized protein CXorf65 homolog [Chanos chanos]|uniref:Uncharacterized protein CXorf65 homolog n=1 Tax=Chanos chanos TaxID=29144 RepID=A0A6J2UQ76_CHACN|nr:uncharacterized protein CXorf65 homolog [Chanos chanos]
MFIYIKHADNEQFLVNTDCPIILLLQYLRTKLGLAETELLDLCDERGTLKLLFLAHQPQESASRLLPVRASFLVCSVNRDSKDGAYVSITPHVTNPDPALIENLKTQMDHLEKARLKKLSSQEDRVSNVARSAQPVSTPSPNPGPLPEHVAISL